MYIILNNETPHRESQEVKAVDLQGANLRNAALKFDF